VTTPLPDLSELVLYVRSGCHLCEQAHEALDLVLAQRAAAGLPVPRVTVRDIEADEELHRRYLVTIPVVAIGGRELELVTSAAKIRRLLAETLDGEGAAA
jgi:glutaredoxin